ncbi:hypothetical protein [Tessaracoccus coleopterorum]|nr:hypothetical protein [Tessaracoccus coleopterorum]
MNTTTRNGLQAAQPGVLGLAKVLPRTPAGTTARSCSPCSSGRLP